MPNFSFRDCVASRLGFPKQCVTDRVTSGTLKGTSAELTAFDASAGRSPCERRDTTEWEVEEETGIVLTDLPL